MQSLIPIISTKSADRDEIILINPHVLSDLHGFKGPFNIAKTSIPLPGKNFWSILIEDNDQRAPILTSLDISGERIYSLNLIEVLGHDLGIAPWQKLIFSSESCLDLSLTFIRSPL